MTLFTRLCISNRFPQSVGRSVPACVVAALAAGLGGVADAQGQGSGDPPPNIVFFLADDMGLGDTSAYQDLTGNPDGYQIDTPHLERLAARGTRFTDAHSNAAVCTPTRLALLSGIHAFRSPIHQRTSFESQDTIGSLMPGDRSTIATMLRDSGYGTYGIGKWHMGLQVDFDRHVVHEGPQQLGFDSWTGTPANFPSSQGLLVDSSIQTYDSRGNVVPFDHPDAQPWNPADLPGDGGREAITESIQQTNLDASQAALAHHVATRGGDPFFLYYASHSNHTPYLAGDELDGQTVDGHTKDGGYLEVPTTTDRNGRIVPTGPDYGNIDLDNHWDPYLRTDAAGNVLRHGPGERGTLIDENDVALGRLLDYLEATDDPRNPGRKLIDNTLIVFTSDNGADMDAEPAVGRLPRSVDGAITDIAGKKATWQEGGTRVPFIAAWAGQIAPGATSDALFGVNDMYATFAELAGHRLESTEAVDSESVVAALRGRATGDFRESALIYKNRDRLIIRQGDLKLVAQDPDADRDGSKFDGNLDFAEMQLFRLYDLGNDLGETNDLKNDPAYRDQVTAMLGQLQTYIDQGYSRSGAVAIGNGVNFQGGDILDPASYLGYGDVGYDPDNTGAFELPRLTRAAPSFIFVDGTAAQRIDDAWLIQGNGRVDLGDGQAGLSNTRYELRGGTLTADTALQVNDGSTLQIEGGSLDLTGQALRLKDGDGLIELSDGLVLARVLTVESLGSATAGQKIVRFQTGPGAVLMLSDDTAPIRFGDLTSADDFIDFVAGSRGVLATLMDEAYYRQLWDDGRLRVDGADAASLADGFGGYFRTFDLGEGYLGLTLVPEPASAVGLAVLLMVAPARRRGRES